MKKNKKDNIDLAEKEEKIRIRDKYQQEIKLFFEEKKAIEEEIKNINLLIEEKEAELKKINEEKHLYNIERKKIEKEEKASTLLDVKRKIEKERWELEKKITGITEIELEIGEAIFEKKTRLKEINVQYSLIKEKILKIEENLVLINNQIKDFDKKEEKIETEKESKETAKEKSLVLFPEEKSNSIILTEKEKKDRLEKIDTFFELFYKKIWLTVVIFDDNEKKNFKEIILSGGADFIPELREYIQKKINQKFPNVTVKIADPFINIDDSNLLQRPKKNSQYSNAIGAALKGFKN